MDLHVPLLQLPQRSTRPHLLAAGLALTGAACVGAAFLGLAWWLKAEMFQHTKLSKPFDALSFVGLLLLITFSALGVTLLYSTINSLVRLLDIVFGLVVFGGLGTAFVTLGSLGMLWGKELMQCLGVFCLNTSKYPVGRYNKPESAVAFSTTLGSAAFFSLLPMGLVMLVQVFIKASGYDRKWLHPSEQKVSIRREYPVLHSMVVFAFLLCFALVTMYCPNDWSLFTPGRIALGAKVHTTKNFTLCRTVEMYTCPELPWSWVFTRSWVWSDSLVLKLYPSNIFFFSYLLIVLLAVTVIRGSRGGRTFLKRRCPSVLHAFSYGEAAFAALTVLMLALFFAYWVGGHNYKCRYDGVKDGTSVTERWARSLGQLAVALMSLCMFPASRYSVLHTVLGTSWEASLWAHKLLGYGMVLFAVAHMIAWYVRYAELGIFVRSVFTLVPVFPVGHADNFTVPLLSLVTWFVLIPMGVLSLEPVRRRVFEVFYYMHLVGFYMIVPCVLWHAAAAWEYLLPGLTVWFLDRLIRMYRSASTAEVVSAIHSGAYVQIRFLHSTLCAGPGQYAFVNIPELSLLEWHPFSLSVSREGCHAFHIKSMGEGTWTGRLLQLVKDRGSDFTLSVDGPCGRVQDFGDYKTIVLVAGGIGVTPCASIYSYLRRQRALTGKGPTATLLWTLRDPELLKMMSHIWDEADPAVDVKDFFVDLNSEGSEHTEMPLRIFLTGVAAPYDISAASWVTVLRERLCFDTEIRRALSDLGSGDALIYACGSSKLVKITRDIGLAMSVNFNEECFYL